jgi:hypothetical protein
METKLIENYPFHQWFADPKNQAMMKRIIDTEVALRIQRDKEKWYQCRDLEWVSTPNSTIRSLIQKPMS